MEPYVVVDACVAGAWSFAEPFTVQATVVLEAIVNRRVVAIAPDRFSAEVLRICQRKVTDGIVAADEGWDRFLDVMTLPIYLHPSDEYLEHTWKMATGAAGLTTHDALYLALAEMWDAELWTLDGALAAQAGAVNPHDLRTTPFPH
jgi:predicted nucleic acid-binding protein